MFLKKLESKKIHGVEVGFHGDVSGNGSRGNILSFYKAFSKSVTGHTHTGQIYKSAYCVGTMSVLDPSYVSGLSSWTHTSCLIYSSGQRQLINCIDNKDGNYTWKID